MGKQTRAGPAGLLLWFVAARADRDLLLPKTVGVVLAVGPHINHSRTPCCSNRRRDFPDLQCPSTRRRPTGRTPDRAEMEWQCACVLSSPSRSLKSRKTPVGPLDRDPR